ncbi:TPA: hypothetical protein ACS3BZ_003935 [Klebsiella pneumoniae]|uniref:Uncharacterized protein n=1 Tax=Klebsiella pneumoniae TaxID=573 RepID=A0A6B2J4D0_KLEPN|nr:hypothetical protein [Klebsiella pneumoniae]MPT43871.1 hypothetical protein [Klebsiella sp.]NDR64259.1 hypothetical protein [Klebsiella pneumoniae]NDR84836.1 hypothetical protein [Klebsiella pneumoniae]NDS00538.1 hypothetical protein [Klebsiella pneumoniae]NDS09914.1 hypothetical protein [Klebsiella pneumoniae]
MSSSEIDQRDARIFKALVDFFGPGTAEPKAFHNSTKTTSVRSLLIHFANYTSFNFKISQLSGPFGSYKPSDVLDFSGKYGYEQWLAELDHDPDYKYDPDHDYDHAEHDEGGLVISVYFTPIVPAGSGEQPFGCSLDATVLHNRSRATLEWYDSGDVIEESSKLIQIVAGKELRLSHVISEPDSRGRAYLNAKIEEVGYL